MDKVSDGAHYVVAGDKMHNVTCMIEDYITIGDELWSRFNAPSKPSDIFWYYEEMHAVLERRLRGVRLVNRLGEGIASLKELAYADEVPTGS